jgi:cation diffusion facilitator CzcD-associated flavoprotein CzcO
MTGVAETLRTGPGVEHDYDVVVVGAGFAGIYALYKLREQGFSVTALEMGSNVGGTWYWNRYPGARVDIQSVEYMFTRFPDLDQEWGWTELMPAQAEVERYINFVTDRLSLREHIRFQTVVTAATYDDDLATWTVETNTGEQLTAAFLVAATGCLSAPLEPEIKGLQSFRGDSLYTNRFPKEGYDFAGKRVAVIGTGSSGVQSIPVIAEQAAQLFVLQRSAAYTLPTPNRPLTDGELDELKAQYPEIRAAQWASPLGTARFGAVLVAAGELPNIIDTPWDDQLKRLDELGVAGAFAWADVRNDIEANRMATRLYAEAIKRVVKDPTTAENLVPHYPFGCKRIILDAGYFETFNRGNVQLVNVRTSPIAGIHGNGIETEDRFLEVDVIVYATGFDAVTGALARMEIRGRTHQVLREAWAAGPMTYLGIGVANFPNLFLITGPGSPSVLTNMVPAIEQHVEFVTNCLLYMRANGYRSVEVSPRAQEQWVEHVNRVARPIQVHESCHSWYLGANVPGKPRFYLPYAGGLTQYMAECDEIVGAGYRGFSFA